MANTILQIQMSFGGGNKTPIVTGSDNGSKRLSFYNLGRFMLGLLVGTKYNQGASWLQYQTTLVSASATATPASVILNDTLSIAGTALTAKQGRATGTATCVTVLANTTLTVNGTVFTGTAGAVTLGDPTFSVDTSDTACATSIAVQVNAYGGSLVNGLVGAKSTAGVVTFYAITAGTAGNSLTLASSDGVTLAVSGAVLANGAALTNNQFDFAGTDITTGAAIVSTIAASTTAAIQSVTATSSATTGVVTVTAKVSGVAGNAVTFTSSNGSRLAVTGSGFLASGSAGAPVRLTL